MSYLLRERRSAEMKEKYFSVILKVKIGKAKESCYTRMDIFMKGSFFRVKSVGKDAKLTQCSIIILDLILSIKGMEKDQCSGLNKRKKMSARVRGKSPNNIRENGGEGFQMERANFENKMVIFT